MILRLVIGIIVIYLLYKLIRKGFPAVGGKPGSAKIQNPAAGEELVEDPQCHTYVPVEPGLPDGDRWENSLFLLSEMSGTVWKEVKRA